MDKTYSCPMHPEVKQNHPGKCPKCGMDLSLTSTINNSNAFKTGDYKPLFVILALITLISLVVTYEEGLTLINIISNFMIGFFLVFSGFKLIDLVGFAQGYSNYDLLAKRWFGYGYLYPFIELFFGLAMILSFQVKLLLIVEVIIMTFSGIGVMLKLLKKEKFQCACLGTFLKIPLTKVTLIEDFGMASLALLLIFIR